MRVVMLYGSRAGEDVDLPPRNAQAMVADGRARWPGEASVAVVEVSPVAVSGAQVTARADRGFPRGKRRSVR